MFTIPIYPVSAYKLHVHNFQLKSIHRGVPEKADNSTVCEKAGVFSSYLISCIINMDGKLYYPYTANSIKVDIDNGQLCNMIDRVPKE